MRWQDVIAEPISSFVVTLGKALNGMPLSLSDYTKVNKWQLDLIGRGHVAVS